MALESTDLFLVQDATTKANYKSTLADIKEVVNTGYVKTTGDNMTGDLTLGTDKITLNVDGTAQFAKQITSTGGLTSWSDGIQMFSPTATVGTIAVSDGPTAGAGTLTFQSGSTETFRITESGDILIGGTLPASPNIELKADGTAEFAGGDVNIDSSGRLLVGTSSPRTSLSFSSVIPSVQFTGSTTSTSSLLLHKYGIDANPCKIILYKNRGADWDSNGGLTVNDPLGVISFEAADGWGGASLVGAEIGAYAETGVNTQNNDQPTRLVFSTTPDNAPSPTERMRIDSSGKVGIGTTSPGSYSSVANNLVVQDTDGQCGLTLASTTTGASNIFFADTDGAAQGQIKYQHSGDYLRFYTAGSERLRLDSSGNALIGGTLPSAPNITLASTGAITALADATINSVRVGLGGGSVSSNTAVGQNALYSNTTGSLNVAIGQSVLFANTEGGSNTAVGRQALRYNTTGNYNTALGQLALYDNTTGINNVAVGQNALYSNTTGNYNTALGQSAGYYIEGSNNTILGAYPGTTADATLSDTVIISAGPNERMRIDSAGNALIGGTLPASPSIELNAGGTIDLGGWSDDGTNQSRLNPGSLFIKGATGSSAAFTILADGYDSNTDAVIKLLKNGSAEFAGSVNSLSTITAGSGSYSVGTNASIKNNGNISASRATGPVWYGYTAGNTTPTSIIYADGSAEFAGVVGTGDGSSTNLAQLQPSGYVLGQRVNANTDAAVILARGNTTGAAKDLAAFYVDGSMRLGGTLPSTPNITLKADGSARFVTASIGTAESPTPLTVQGPTNDEVATFYGSSGDLTRKFVLSNSNNDNDWDFDAPRAGQGNLSFSTGSIKRLFINADGSASFTGDVEFDGDIAADGVYTGAVTAVAALAIDCSSSNYFTKTINANSTFTFTNVPATRAFSFTLELTHTSGTVTWPASVKWPADTAPSLATGKTHLFMFITDDGGTTFRGASLVDYTN